MKLTEKQSYFWQAFNRSEQKARSGKWSRLLRSPFWYPVVMFYQYVWYPLTKKEWNKRVNTFFGTPMRTLLPSGTDISLNGIKSHDSEIRLSKFLVLNLKPGQTFIDVGAHYGYYSLLASRLSGPEGLVFAIEASSHSFSLLKKNTSHHSAIQIYHCAAGDHEGEITFYEYPGPYAEYNTMVAGMYDNAEWRKKIPQTKTTVALKPLDKLLPISAFEGAIVKMDVEGGELQVLKGMAEALQSKGPMIIMEYLNPESTGGLHETPVNYLAELGYLAYRIQHNGELMLIRDIPGMFSAEKGISDNLVFIKK